MNKRNIYVNETIVSFFFHIAGRCNCLNCTIPTCPNYPEYKKSLAGLALHSMLHLLSKFNIGIKYNTAEERRKMGDIRLKLDKQVKIMDRKKDFKLILYRSFAWPRTSGWGYSVSRLEEKKTIQDAIDYVSMPPHMEFTIGIATSNRNDSYIDFHSEETLFRNIEPHCSHHHVVGGVQPNLRHESWVKADKYEDLWML